MMEYSDTPETARGELVTEDWLRANARARGCDCALRVGAILIARGQVTVNLEHEPACRLLAILAAPSN